MSLLSLVLTLRPQAEAGLSGALGRAAHAALLNAVTQFDPKLARQLHDAPGARPFTCSLLSGERQDGGVEPDRVYTLRYTALIPELSDVLPGLFKPQSIIELGGVPFVVESACDDPSQHTWAGRASYADLSAPWLLARRLPETHVRLHLASPTVFKSGGKAQLFPLPGLVFGSLLERWNAYAPMALPEEVRRFAAEYMAASRFTLHTRAAPFKRQGGAAYGAVGHVTYIALDHDRYYLSAINLLADFACFAGIGSGASIGMGQAKRVVENKS